MQDQAPVAWERPGLKIKLAYALPFFALGAMGAPIAIELKIFYTDTMLIPAGLLALAIAVSRVFDVITDPLVGWISDQTRTRWGRRKPWLPGGVLLSGLFYWLMFAPPRHMTAVNDLLLWAGITFCLYYIFHTVWNVPYQGLGLELSPDYRDRTRLFGLRAFIAFVGVTAAFFIIFASKSRGVFADERQMLFTITGGLALLSFVLFIIPLAKLREYPEFSKRERFPLIPGVRRIFRNRPFRIVMFSVIVTTIPNAIPTLIMPYFSKYVLVLEDQYRAIFAGLYTLAGFLSIPLWVLLGRYVEKYRMWMIASIVGIITGFLMYTLGEGDVAGMVVLEIIRGTTVGALLILIPAILADVVDYDELRTGKRSEAMFTALVGLIPKFVTIFAAALPLAVLGAVGYNPATTSLSPDAVLTIRILFALVPLGFHVAVLVIIRHYQITRVVHETIRNNIADRQQGKETFDPVTGESLLPMDAQVVDEDTGWFLDNFSKRELARMAADGQDGLLRRVFRQVAVSGLLSLGLVGAAIWLLQGALSISQADQLRQGLAACLVIFAGMALTAMFFHLMRVRAATKMTAEPVDRGTILDYIERL